MISKYLVGLVVVLGIAIAGGAWWLFGTDKADEGAAVGTIEEGMGENDPDPLATPWVKEFTVEGSNFKFSLSEMKVKKGDTVKITFKNSGGMHDFKLDEFNVATKV